MIYSDIPTEEAKKTNHIGLWPTPTIYQTKPMFSELFIDKKRGSCSEETAQVAYIISG